MSEINPCPCGSGTPFNACCEPVIKGEAESLSAEQLLRARYSAVATGNAQFLLDTTHPSERQETSLDSVQKWSESATWTGLEILSSKSDAGDKVSILFVARYTRRGARALHRERSYFERHEGRWYFLRGDLLKNPTVRYDAPRTGRNEPCPCRSGLKYKKCCAA